MNIRNVLENEIENEFEELGKIEVGTDKYKSAVDGVTKLVDKAIDLEKFYIEMEDKVDARENEADLKAKQIKNDKRDQIVRNGIAIAGIVVPTAITIWGTLTTLKFEEVGTVTTNAGRAFMNRLFKK